MDKKIKTLKKAVESDNVKAHKGVDMELAKEILSDDKVKFTYLGSHDTFPGKEGEYIYTVASVRVKGDEPRTWGWMATEEEARQAVAANAGDMCEANYYRYAVIEKVASGICCIDLEQIAWFNWNGKKWIECPQPEWAKDTWGWTL